MLLQQYVFLDSTAVDQLTPSQVESYLENRGWIKEEMESPSSQIWVRPDGEALPDHLQVLPDRRPYRIWPGYVRALTSTHFRDYAASTTQLLLVVALFEHRLAAHVLADMAARPHPA